jgi:long-chain acyl-CoA synthetase
MQIQDILRQVARQYPQKPAIIFKGKTISFPELEKEVLILANALKKHGIKKGDKIGIYLPNSPAYAVSYLACFCLGAVGVPLDYMLKEDELVSCLSHSETRLLLAKDKGEISLESIRKQVTTLQTIVLLDSQSNPNPVGISYEKFIQGSGSNLEKIKISDTDPSLIMYTSGTTGKPKGILLNTRHLRGSPDAMKYFVDLSDKDVKLAAIPLSHIGGFIYVQNCIVFGITVVLMERFNPFEFLESIQRYHVTCFHIVPAMYTAMLSVKKIDQFNLSSLRWAVVFGAPSSKEILERFHQYCPNAKLLNGWGMTETCPPNTVTPFNSTKIESVGKPAPNSEIKIVDENNQALPTGQIGEIVIRGWVVMDGYYKDPQETARMMNNGWLHTGDLGRFDVEGFLYIVGRKKEMIKVAGQIVFAPEVEAALYQHEAVAEAAVIGIPDKVRGEALKAFVVVKEGQKIAPEDLRYFVKDHLAHFKVPQIIELRESLPKNRTGKIDKAALEQLSVP